jgi:hypothetical protein
MRWTWVVASDVEDPDLADALATGWDTREDAEAWMTTAFEALLDEGITQATLTKGVDAAYTMSLEP